MFNLCVYLIFILCYQFSSYAQEPLYELKIEELSAIPSTSLQGNIDSIWKFHGQKVIVRGFYYDANPPILAAQPNLKSCCVNDSNKKLPKITLLNDQIIFEKPTSNVSVWQGIFYIDTVYDKEGALNQLYSLKEAHLVPSALSYMHYVWWSIFAVMIYILIKRLNIYKKN